MRKITILIDNHVRQRGLLAEHGLSLWVECHDHSILFDAGQTDAYLHNAAKLGIDVSSAFAIVLSHGHYDHGGGLAYFPHQERWPRIFAHPDAFSKRFAMTKKPDENDREIGLPWQPSDLPFFNERLMLNDYTMQIGDNMVVCTGIPSDTDFEEVPTGFLIEKNGSRQSDLILDEQMCICSLPAGLIVLLGCSHPGVVNCLKYAKKLFPGKRIHTVIGGMHLEQAGSHRVQKTIEYFYEQNIERIVPLHCTGQEIIWRMKTEMGERILPLCTGDTLSFPS